MYENSNKIILIFAIFGCSNQWASDALQNFKDLSWQGKIAVVGLPFVPPIFTALIDKTENFNFLQRLKKVCIDNFKEHQSPEYESESDLQAENLLTFTFLFSLPLISVLFGKSPKPNAS